MWAKEMGLNIAINKPHNRLPQQIAYSISCTHLFFVRCMKLFLPPNQQSCHQFYGISMALRALRFCTQTLTRAPSVISPLKRMIMRAGDPRASIVPILDNWVQQGKEIKHSQLQKFIRNLRSSNRFNHALEMSQWMCDKEGYELSAADLAVQLDLTSRVHGIEHVEMYFNAIPYNLRGFEVYGALLSCYAHHKCLEKAEATMQKLRELGFVRNALTYNVMMAYYSKIGEYKKLDILAEEMGEKGISCNRVTYNIQLKAYAANMKIEEMEKLLMKLEADPLLNIDWYHYVVAAEGYLNAGVVEKTLTMLKKSEESIEGNLSRLAYERFFTLYAAVGHKAEVYRLWSLYKHIKGFYNIGYLCMIDFLTKMDDIDGAERIWEEWFSKKKDIDIRIPNSMIRAYAKKVQWEKAEAFILKITERGIEPVATTLDLLATAYHLGSQMDRAAETARKAISLSKPGWKPNIYTMAACFEYLKGQGYDVATEELSKMLKEHCGLSPSVCDKLKSCSDDGNLASKALSLIGVDNQSLGSASPAVVEFEDKSSSEL